MSGKSIVVIGATGMVGGIVVRRALADPEVAAVTVIGRRPSGVAHPKLREVLHRDFADCGALGAALAGHDAALYCLGAYTGAIPDAEFRRVTLDYTVAFATALRAHSPGAAFCFLSGQGADPTERSRMSFARYKGAAEKALLASGFPRVHIFRPGYIHASAKRTEPNWTYRLMRSIYPVVGRIYPNIGVTSEDLGAAMLAAALHGTPGHPAPVLENKHIRAMGKAAAA